MSAPTPTAWPPLRPPEGRPVIQARQVSVWKGRYDITEGQRRVATWEKSLWTTGGIVELDGRRLQVRVDLMAGGARMVESGGHDVATAHGIGRKNWTIHADGTTYHFRRAAPWRQEQKLLDGGRPVGWVRRTSFWRGDAAAHLPGMPRTVEIFALALALTTWDADAAASG